MSSSTDPADPEYDQVKVFSHEGDGENTEYLNSMDLHDVKTELEKDAEKAETPKTVFNATSTVGQTSNAITSTVMASVRPVLHPQMVYANGFMVPPIYPVTAAGIGPIKMEGADWAKVSQGQISLPAYGYPAGFVSGLPMDQSGLRPAYPFMIPGQYVAAQMPYHQQLTTLGHPIAPNAAVQLHSGIITPQVKEKKPHIKKPLNAFMLFMKEKRADVIKEYTLRESAAINQILGKMWHALDKSEQAKYYEKAREERARHMQLYPNWTARDNFAVHKKRKKRKIQQVVEEEDNDPRKLKCRARYGAKQSDMWCCACRHKKKCTREDEEPEAPPQKEALELNKEKERKRLKTSNSFFSL